MSVQKYFNEKLRDKFVKNFLTLFSGSLAGQAILFAFTPFLTRIYPEQIFGLLFLFSSVAAVLRVIASLRFEIAVVLPQEDKHAINILVISLIINFILNLFFFFLIVLFYDVINNFSGENNLGNWLYAIPLSSFLLGVYEMFSYWSNRIERYKDISFSKVTKSTVTGASQVFFKYTYLNANGLILGVLLGQFMAVVHIFVLSSKNIIYNLQYFSIKKSIVLIKKYKEIPIYNTILSALNTLSNQLPIILLAKFYGPEPAAYFGLANRVIMTPMGLVAQSVGQVFYKSSTDIINKGQSLYPSVKRTYYALFRIGIVSFILIIAASFFFEFIFGSGWESAGLYTRIASPWLFIAFLNSPLTWILIVLNKQKLISVFDFILLIFRFLALFLPYKFMYSHFTAVYMFSAVGFFYGIIMFAYILYLSKQDLKPYSKNK